MQCPKIMSTTVEGLAGSLEETEVNSAINIGIIAIYSSEDESTQVKYVNREALERWITYNLHNSYLEYIEAIAADHSNINAYGKMAMQVVVNMTGTAYAVTEELKRFIRNLFGDWIKKGRVNKPMQIMQDMFEQGTVISEALTGDVWFRTTIDGKCSRAQLREQEHGAGYSMICFACVEGREENANYRKVLFSSALSREVINMAYATFMKDKVTSEKATAYNPESISLIRETIAGREDNPDTCVDTNEYVGVIVEYDSHEDTTTIEYAKKGELAEWILYRVHSEFSRFIGDVIHNPDDIDGYSLFCTNIILRLKSDFKNWPRELPEFLMQLFIDPVFQQRILEPIEIVEDMFESGVALKDVSEKAIWFNSQVRGTPARAQLNICRVKGDYFYSLICFDGDNKVGEKVDYQNVILSTLLSSKAITTAYAKYLMKQGASECEMLRLSTVTAEGDVHSLDDTNIDSRKNVGLRVDYCPSKDESVITYCTSKGLRKWYKSYIGVDKKARLYDDETLDANWARAYGQLCEITTLQICGDSEGWCMDLAGFYSVMLWIEPAEYIVGMFKAGLLLEEMGDDSFWWDTQYEGDTYHVHLLRENGGSPVFDMTVYGYYPENEDAVDYENIIYEAKVTEALIKRASKQFDESVAKKKKEDTSVAVGVPSKFLNENTEVDNAENLIRKLKIARKAINDVLAELGE